MIVVIPAYQPDEKLLKTVAELRQKTAYTLIVIDDGSSPDRQPIFDKLEHDVTVLHHEVNRGKGAAMKTAFAYIQEHFPGDEGIVTVDADGQHLVPDIVRVSEDWAAHPDALVLGGCVSAREGAGTPLPARLYRQVRGSVRGAYFHGGASRARRGPVRVHGGAHGSGDP